MLLEDALAAYRQRVRAWAVLSVGGGGKCRLCDGLLPEGEPERHKDGCPAAPEGAQVLDDGFGNIWSKCGQPNCGLQIVRPGKVQCDKCRTTMERR